MMNTASLDIKRLIHKKVVKLMGNRFELTVVGENGQKALEDMEAAIAEIQRIEQLLTTFSQDSDTARINASAGKSPVVVAQEVIELVNRARRISELTQGAFDISYGSIDKRLWNFDVSMKTLPDADTAKKAIHLIDYRNIVTDIENHTVFLKREGMRIGFGGIGKGYAAEKAKALLRTRGVHSGIVNAAGDLTAWGYQPDGKPWTIGIADPNASRTAFSYLNITNTSVATSGNYEKFITIDGQRYSHTIDPKSGLPVKGIKSVTIFCPNAEIADAMATPVMVMGIRVGLDLVNQVKGLECIVVDDSDCFHTSKNISLR